MQADFSVEIGPDEAALEVPWASSGDSSVDSPHYFDLRAQPELLLNIPEAHHNRPLGEFLSALNSPASRLQTAKCDTWRSDEISAEEQVFGASCKFASYVDLFFADDEPRYSFPHHEQFAQSLCKLLAKAPEISAAAEFVLRRCYFHDSARDPAEGGRATRGRATPPADDSRDGFCLSFYLSGYGDDDHEARKRWSIGLKLVENAILQLAARSRV